MFYLKTGKLENSKRVNLKKKVKNEHLSLFRSYVQGLLKSKLYEVQSK